MKKFFVQCIVTLLLLITFTESSRNEMSTGEPLVSNLQTVARISATGTCGVGVTNEEPFCKITGGQRHGYEMQTGTQRGFQCLNCSATNYLPINAIDGKSYTSWNSPPLSRGEEWNNVNLTLEFDNHYRVDSIHIKTGEGPRPAAFGILRTTDGHNWQPWIYFAKNCQTTYGMKAKRNYIFTNDTEIICIENSENTQIQGYDHDAEINVLLNFNRPSGKNPSRELKKWLTTRGVRLMFNKFNTFEADKTSRMDSEGRTITNRIFYSIRSLFINGRCLCNGLGSSCLLNTNSRTYQCECLGNAEGDTCNRCKDGFQQRPWKSGVACEKCNCFNHSETCFYNETVAKFKYSMDIKEEYSGGGVCTNCRDNTLGINCRKCDDGYFHPRNVDWYSPKACQKCQCDPLKSNGKCDQNGRCECANRFAGLHCDKCAVGYTDFPECRPCDCNSSGSALTSDGRMQCNMDGGQCQCRYGFGGKTCNECAFGHFGFPNCAECTCKVQGSLNNNCDQKRGNCSCKTGFTGSLCNKCADGYWQMGDMCYKCFCGSGVANLTICSKKNGECFCRHGFHKKNCGSCVDGFYGYPDCQDCKCNPKGSVRPLCNEVGQCECKLGYQGLKCDECAEGFFFSKSNNICTSCLCNKMGSLSENACNPQTGVCTCKNDLITGRRCDQCQNGYNKFPICSECLCNEYGSLSLGPDLPVGGCFQEAEQPCLCKDNVEGLMCEQCKDTFWNLTSNTSSGCSDCVCNKNGVLFGDKLCHPNTGQCVCKANVMNPQCDSCVKNTYGLKSNNLFGCINCDCNEVGSRTSQCDDNGNCSCVNPTISGMKCDRPAEGYYCQDMEEYRIEAEKISSTDDKVRFEFNETLFFQFSYLGVASLSSVQSSLTFKWTNYNSDEFYISIKYYNFVQDTLVTLAWRNENEDSYNFIETMTLNVTSNNGSFISSKNMISKTTNRDIVIKIELEQSTSDQIAFIDYITILPVEIISPKTLNYVINQPCKRDQSISKCVVYKYLTLSRTIATLNTEISSIDSPVNITLTPLRISKVHVIVEYVSLNISDDAIVALNVDIGQFSGIISLFLCPYSFTCRQVLETNKSGDLRPLIVDMTTEMKLIKLTFLTDSIQKIQIKSISFVDAEEAVEKWLLPVPSHFLFWNNIVPLVQDLTVGMTKQLTSSGEEYVEFEANVLETEEHVFLVKYEYSSAIPPNKMMQANVTEMLIGEVSNNDARNDAFVAVANISFCAAYHGCYTKLKMDEVNMAPSDFRYLSANRYSINITKMAGLKVISVYVVSRQKYLEFEPLLNSKNNATINNLFAKRCLNSGDESFSLNDEEMCKEAMFLISTNRNNRESFKCQCNPQGSANTTCNPMGGKCLCKENVVGRTCSRCKMGFYGFPNCQKCDCFGNLCNEETGACNCPQNVIGYKCDRCREGTYGYNVITGCSECICNTDGVVAKSDTCNSETGICRCKESITGRTCDECIKGYHGFPNCEPCSCNFNGTIAKICDQQSAQCLCKENVDGEQCDVCKNGYFNLQSSHSNGCLPCYCSGISSECTLSEFGREKVSVLPFVRLLSQSNVVMKHDSNKISIRTLYSKIATHSKLKLYSNFTSLQRSMVTYYGAKLEIHFENIEISTHDQLEDNLYITLNSRQGAQQSSIRGLLLSKITNFNDSINISVIFDENTFEFLNGTRLNRFQMLKAMSFMNSVDIPINIKSSMSSCTISLLTLEVMHSEAPKESSHSVEKCSCAQGYRGFSCETPAFGWYISVQVNGQRKAQECSCNGRSNQCSNGDGACFNCSANFSGDYCEKCLPQHYQFEDACYPCKCPTILNNFATQCARNESSLIEDDSDCQICQEGHEGIKCEKCQNGYYGNPLQGIACKKCSCNNNLDLSQENSCHSLTGECLKCMPGISGANCDMCGKWMFGDALKLKNCQDCLCNQNGSVKCNKVSGKCLCKENVEGEMCDRCMPGYFGFKNSSVSNKATFGGCTLCNCSLGATSANCDALSGRCLCSVGVIGLKCDQCDVGYYGYGPRGCKECNCTNPNHDGCEASSGKCKCRTGVSGENCDQCARGWINTPSGGCQVCDHCVFMLMNTTDFIDTRMSYVTTLLRDVLKPSTFQEFSQTLSRQMQSDMQKFDYIELTSAKLLDQLQNKSDSISKYIAGESSKIHKSLQTIQLVQMKVSSFLSNLNQTTRNINSVATNVHIMNPRNVLDKINEEMEAFQLIRKMNVSEYVRREMVSADYLPTVLSEESNRQLKGVEQKSKSLDEAFQRIQSYKYTFKRNLKDIVQVERKLQKQIRSMSSIVSTSDSKFDKMSAIEKLLSNHWSENVLTNLLQSIRNNVSILENDKQLIPMLFQNISQIMLTVNATSKNRQPLITNIRATLINDLKDFNNLPNVSNTIKNNLQIMRNAYSIITGHWADINKEPSFQLIEALSRIPIAFNGADKNAVLSSQILTTIGNTNLQLSSEKFNVTDKKAKCNLLNGFYVKFGKEIPNKFSSIVNEIQQLNFLSAQLDWNANSFSAKSAPLVDAAKEFNRLIKVTQRSTSSSQLMKSDAGVLLNESSNLLIQQKNAYRVIRMMKSNLQTYNFTINQLVQRNLIFKRDTLKNLVAQFQLTLSNINKTKQRIEYMRSILRNINKATGFSTKSSLSMPIAHLSDLVDRYKISIDIQPEGLALVNGLIMYMGTVATEKSQSYFALEIVDRKIQYSFALQSASTRNVLRSDVSIVAGEAYTIVIERYGKVGLLHVSSCGNPSRITKMTNFNISAAEAKTHFIPSITKLFVGGVPDAYLSKVSNHLTHTRFVGVIQNIVINKEVNSLWEFDEVQYVSRKPALSCLMRKIEKVFLNGESYLRFNNLFGPNDLQYFQDSIDIYFEITTFSKDGVIIDIEMPSVGSNAVSVRIVNGILIATLLQKSTAGIEPVVQLNSMKIINDGQLYKVKIMFSMDKSALNINNQVTTGEGFGQKTLQLYYILLMGKSASQPSIAEEKLFEGLLQNVSILNKPLIMSKGIPFGNVLIGSAVKENMMVSRLVQINGGALQFELPKQQQNDNNRKLSFSFKTNISEGVIFELKDNNKKSFLVIKLESGILTFDLTGFKSNRFTNEVADGAWHDITIEDFPGGLKISVDSVTKTDFFNKQIIAYIHFGDVENSKFFGCFQNVIYNDGLLNLLSATRKGSKNKLRFNECTMEDISEHRLKHGDELRSCALSKNYRQMNFKDAKLFNSAENTFSNVSVKSFVQNSDIPKFIKEYIISVDFRTDDVDGIIFFAEQFESHVLVYLNGGRIIAIVTEHPKRSVKRFDDNKWHTLTIQRNVLDVGSITNIIVDNEILSFNGGIFFKNIIKRTVFLGGMPKTLEKKAFMDLSGFNGCMRNLSFSGYNKHTSNLLNAQMNGTNLPRNCNADIQKGIYFGIPITNAANRQYMFDSSKSTMNAGFQVMLTVKPRSNTGVLFIHMNVDGDGGIILSLENGRVVLRYFSSAQTNTTVSFSMRYRHNICDGQWHTIAAEEHYQYIEIIVDNDRGLPVKLPNPIKPWNGNFMLGGIPEPLAMKYSLPEMKNYLGCIKKLTIKDTTADFQMWRTVENVSKDGCYIN